MSNQQHHTARGGAANKVAIPRLERRVEPPRKPSVTRQNRVSRACLSCRARKIKCDGEQPTCRNCNGNSSPCVYMSSRKDRLKTATDHNQDMIQLLKDLRDTVVETQRQKIDELLGDVTGDVADAVAALGKKPQDPEPMQLTGGEADVSAEVGSNEDLDQMDEDLLRTEKSRATGFHGKNSEVHWFRKLDHEANSAAQNSPVPEGPFGPAGTSAQASAKRTVAMQQRQAKIRNHTMPTNEFSFYLDDEVLDMDFVVDPFELPPLHIADRLLKCYMENAQNSFPIVAKQLFMSQFYHYYASVGRGKPYKVPQNWQAMLNLVLAIGAAYSHLVGAEWRADERDHYLYHARAWALSLKDPWWFSHPDLPQIQTTGLLSLYYLAIGHISRSWVVIGMAVRSAVGLGLHVQNEDHTASAMKKEILSRVWWGLYSVERILCAITGRPSVGTEAHYSVALPLPIATEDIEEERIRQHTHERARRDINKVVSQSEASSVSSQTGPAGADPREPANTGSYLRSTVRLGMIIQRVLNELYTPVIVKNSWKDVQLVILTLSEELELWVTRLPAGLNFLHDDHANEDMKAERNNLRVFYHSTQILITRPCLCRLDRRIQNQSQQSNEFNRKMASSCVAGAMAIANILPNINEHAADVFEVFPWWATVHYIMQSIAVLMLDISYEAAEVHYKVDTIPSLKKLVRWLRFLRSRNGMARRAYAMTLDVLRKLAIRIQIDITDLVNEESVEAQRAHDISQLYRMPSTHQYMGEEFLEQLPAENTYRGVPGSFGMTADLEPPLPDLFFEPMQSNSPLANLFFTGFDQQNPLPMAGGDVYVDDQFMHQHSQRP